MHAHVPNLGQTARRRAAVLTAAAVVSALLLTLNGPAALAAPSNSIGLA